MEAFLLLCVISAATWIWLQRRKAERTRVAFHRETAALKEELARVSARVVALSKYEPIEDVDTHVRAQHELAELIAVEARSKAGEVMRVAQSEASTLLQQAHSKVTASQVQAAATIDAAQRKAEEIAGEAFAAIRQAKQLEDAIVAMKNVVSGYGERYLVPALGFLDELGEAFGFTEAGQKLKEQRLQVREMITKGVAATCDYAEPARRSTAIHFVLDAFNGKVDSILADVRHDNYGTLEQKLKDAFALVNKNGQAFRNARIEPKFLQARVLELKWAVAAHELKLQEREEQRALKERIREEQRAQRDYEKAMKEAAKEEDSIRKAMEKARREIDRATSEQREKYELQLAELAQKLQLAEEKNQRALSMAQQTKAGYVYVISNIGSFGEEVFKIGLTRRLEPLDRIKELGDASVPFEFDVHALIRADDAPSLERELHKHFVRAQVNKINPRKEFFRVQLAEIRRAAEKLGCQAAWTMTAAGREFRETQALEKSMTEHTTSEAAWAEQQMREFEKAAHSALINEEELEAAAL